MNLAFNKYIMGLRIGKIHTRKAQPYATGFIRTLTCGSLATFLNVAPKASFPLCSRCAKAPFPPTTFESVAEGDA